MFDNVNAKLVREKRDIREHWNILGEKVSLNNVYTVKVTEGEEGALAYEKVYTITKVSKVDKEVSKICTDIITGNSTAIAINYFGTTTQDDDQFIGDYNLTLTDDEGVDCVLLTSHPFSHLTFENKIDTGLIFRSNLKSPNALGDKWAENDVGYHIKVDNDGVHNLIHVFTEGGSKRKRSIPLGSGLGAREELRQLINTWDILLTDKEVEERKAYEAENDT